VESPLTPEPIASSLEIACKNPANCLEADPASEREDQNYGSGKQETRMWVFHGDLP